MTTPIIRFDPTAWVDDAPFAAHLAHLSATTGLPWTVVATYAGVPLRAAHRMMAGRRGPRLHRLPHAMARRLLEVSSDELLRLRSTWVAADACHRRVGELVGSGVAVEHLAHLLGCTPDLVARLADGSPTTVTAELALRARVACETADRALFRRALHAA